MVSKKFPRAVPQAVMTTVFRHAFQIINHWLPFIHRHNTDEGPPESPDGSQTNFSTNKVFKSGDLDVYVNGVLQKVGYDYTEDSDQKGYTFTNAPRTYAGRDVSTGELRQTIIQHRYIVDD